MKTGQLSPQTVVIKVVEDNNDLTTGDGKTRFTIPERLDRMNLTTIAGHVYTTSSSANISIALYNITDSQDMLSTNLIIDAGEKDSITSSTACVINTSYDDVVTADELRIDCDVAGTNTKGLELRLTFSP